MASLVQENTKFQHHFQPMLLKDFLRDEASPNSYTTVASPKSNKSSSSSSHIVLLRSWSKRAAATRISAVHKVIKLLQSRPSILSRRLTKRGKKDDNDIFGEASEVKVSVRVKDILRWKSFRDLVEDNPTPSDFAATPFRTTATSCGKRSNWCDSDFTAEELPLWCGENGGFGGKNAATSRNNHPEGDWSSFEEEYEQQSPVSVLESPFRKVQEFITPNFHPLLTTTVQRAKHDLMQRTQSFKEEIAICEVNLAEEKAEHLLCKVKEEDKHHMTFDDNVILDFFIDELSRNGKLIDDESECKIMRIAKSWMEGEMEECYEWEMEEERESFVKDMERGVCWNTFEEDQQELCEELEFRVLDHLINDIVSDFLLMI